MKEGRLQIGIIGCGVIAPVHIDSYLLCDGVDVKAICDIREDRIESIVKRYTNNQFETYLSVDEMLEDDSIDAVSICTDHASHESLFNKSLSAGKHVLCEKALTTNRASLDRMLVLAATSNQVSSGVFQHRFDPIYVNVKKVLESGLLGQLLTVNVEHNCFRSEAYYTGDAWRGTMTGEGGSLLINQSIHFIDILQWVMGGVLWVQGCTLNLGHSGVIETEDTAAVNMKFRSGSLGSFTATSSAYHNWQSSFHFVGKNGFIRIENGVLIGHGHKDKVLAERIENEIKEEPDEDEKTLGKAYYGAGHPGQIADFVSAIKESRAPSVTIAEAAEAMRIVFSIYESAQSGKRTFIR